MNATLRRLLFAVPVGLPLSGQSFTDFTEARNPPTPFASLFQLELGAIGTMADAADPARGLDDEIGWDAKVWYRDDRFLARRGTLEAYAGRDGLFGSFADGKLIGDETQTRFEVRARPWQFYRDGYWDDGHLVPNGFYDGEDYEGYVGFGREAQQGLYIEIGPYYRKHDFARSDLTPATFRIPRDFSAYGGRLYLEQSTVQMDRRRGLPREGYVFTLTGEREWNGSRGEFGADGFETELPSAVWRVRGHLDWYIPASDTTCWEIFAAGGWHDEKDRLQNTDASRVLGNQWADAQLRLRLDLGGSVTITPFFHAQYSRLLDATGFASDKEFFFGGGAEGYLHFSDELSLHAWYSFVDSESRPSVRIDEDVHGEHMFYVGMVLRLGASRR
jgi:hypothetical protein